MTNTDYEDLVYKLSGSRLDDVRDYLCDHDEDVSIYVLLHSQNRHAIVEKYRACFDVNDLFRDMATYALYTDVIFNDIVSYGLESYYIDDYGFLVFGDGDLIQVPHTSWGDYCGDMVTRSNYNSLKNLNGFKAFNNGIYADVSSCDWALLIEIIKCLENYPVYLDSEYDQLCLEIEEEDWRKWIESDVRRELNKYDYDHSSLTMDAIRRVARDHGICWEPETATSGTIDVRAIATIIRRET